MTDAAHQEIRAAKQRRLDELKLQAARLGVHTPAEVAIEIDDLEAELARGQALDRAIDAASGAAAAWSSVREAGPAHVLVGTQTLILTELASLRSEMRSDLAALREAVVDEERRRLTDRGCQARDCALQHSAVERRFQRLHAAMAVLAAAIGALWLRKKDC